MEKRAPRSAYRVIQILLLLAIAAGCVFVLQRSIHSVRKAPRLEVDDSLPNVALTLAHHGRYGFLASPTQAPTGADRTHAFFNYGPLYFYVAAALTWLFGPSLTLYRMLHPLGLVFIAALSLWTFRRLSLLGGAAVTAALLQIYWQSAWPMARPDIMVSICAALMFGFAASAMERDGWLNWAAMGFFAASAATTHPIAAAVVPAAGLAWLWHGLATRGEHRAQRSFTALVSGGIAGALVFLFAIQFRVRDLLSLGSGRLHQLGSSYARNFAEHFHKAWGDLNGVEACAVAIVFGVATLTLIASCWIPMQRKRIVAYLAAPVITAFAYSFSIGFYGDYHTGYVILCQVAVAWSIGAFLALATQRIGGRTGSRRFETAAMLATFAMFAVLDVHWAFGIYPWDLEAGAYADHVDYVREVTSLLPERASAGGSLYFGLESGDRTDLVQFLDMLAALRDFQPGRTGRLAPDFLVLSPYEIIDAFERDAKRSAPLIEEIARRFPQSQYRLTNLVYAPPYGTTHIYTRTAAADELPGVSVNDGVSRQWSRGLGPTLETAFEPVSPVTMHITRNSAPPNRALTTRRGYLSAGFYLIETKLDGVGENESGIIAATPGSYFYYPGYTGFSPAVAAYWPGQSTVFLLIDHFGGPLYISRFATFYQSQHEGNYGFEVASVRKVEALTNDAQHAPLPDWTKWRVTNSGVHAALDAGGFRLTGSALANSTLLESPPIAVPPHTRLNLIVPTTTQNGAIKILVKGNTPLTTAQLMPARVALETGRSSQIVISLAAADLQVDGPLDVTLGAPLLVATQNAPDLLTLGRDETEADFIRAATGLKPKLESLSGERYRLVHLAYAPPNGTTRDYARVRDGKSPLPLPAVEVNDGVSRQWSRNAGEPIAAHFEPVAPVHVSIAQGNSHGEVEAKTSLAADLPPGFYLIEAAVGPSANGSFVAATPGRYLRWSGNSNELALAPVLPHGDHAFLLADHFGGKLYLSLFGKQATKLEITSVRPIPVLRNSLERIAPIAVPAWKSTSKGVSLTASEDGWAELTGTAPAGATLIESEPFRVPAHTKLVLTMPVDAASGAVRMGVSDAQGNWLAPPAPAPRRVLFDSGNQTQASITLVNGMGNVVPVDVHLGPVSIQALVPKSLYVDSLMACRSFTAPKSPDCK